MARDSDALLIRKWASNGDVQTPEDRGLTRSLGWPADYALRGGRKPTREVFNQLFREFSALGHEINTRGLLDWDASVAYVHPALVREPLSGIIYTSAQSSTNQNPATDDGSYWVQFGATGWSPRLAVVNDGYRRVLQIVGWVGGIGSPPGHGQYIGPSGLVNTATEAVDIGSGVPTGGAVGQVLVKDSTADFDMRWGNVISGYKVGGDGFQSTGRISMTASGNFPVVIASASEDLLIVGWSYRLTGGQDFELDIRVGNTVRWSVVGAATSETIIFPYAIAVAEGERVTMTAGAVGRRDTGNRANFYYVAESDLIPITP